jgi:predicted RNase H-like HicB family nuclease
MKEMEALVVRAFWDNEVEVWVATSDDVPGLVTEAATKEELLAKLQIMIPELLEANGVVSGANAFRLLTQEDSVVKLQAVA